MSLETILEEGKFPAFCPSCYSEALEQDQKPAVGRIEDSTLTFLQRSGVISRELQFRFMQQQARGSEGPLFFRCPAKCGNHLLWEKVKSPNLNLSPDHNENSHLNIRNFVLINRWANPPALMSSRRASRVLW